MNWNKPFETKSGLKARLLGVLKNAACTHVVATTEPDGNECVRQYKASGEYSSTQSPFDLINPPTEVSTREAFAHVYELADGTHRLGSFVYATKASAIEGRNQLLNSGFSYNEHGVIASYRDHGKHLGVTKLNTRVKIEE